MSGDVLAGLDEVPWDALEAVLGRPATEVPPALRALARAGAAATEEDCWPLYDLLQIDTRRRPSAAAAALPFLVVLARDRGMGARAVLVELLVALAGGRGTTEPEEQHAAWSAAWARLRPAVLDLLADPDPRVRGAALQVADLATLQRRWHTEEDNSVRLLLLLELGTATAEVLDAATRTGGTGPGEDATGIVAEVTALLGDVLTGGDPVLRVAAVHAWACIDPREAPRHAALLADALADPEAGPRFEETWRVQDMDATLARAEVVRLTGRLLDDAPEAWRAFVVRLAEAAGDHGASDLAAGMLDSAWDLLVRRPSATGAVLRIAGGLLDHEEDEVRVRAANLLAVLGRASAPWADRLAAHLDDPGEYWYYEGTVAEYARWALARIGDERALPGLVERLFDPYRDEYLRSYCSGDPHRPDIAHVLVPLRAHAPRLLPALRKELREQGGGGPLTGTCLEVLRSWGPASLPALPDVLTLVGSPVNALLAAEAIVAMGPGAASARDAVHACTGPSGPLGDSRTAVAAEHLGGDRDAPLRAVAALVLSDDDGARYALHRLAEFGSAAAPYADRVRAFLDTPDKWQRMQAAYALWAITGEADEVLPVLTEVVRSVADGGGDWGLLREALGTLARIGTVSTAARTALLALHHRDGRLSPYEDYRAFLDDETMRATVTELLALDGSDR